jgi:hypothetical protein
MQGDDIKTADILMQQGKKELARDILREMLQRTPKKAIYYKDAVNIYMLGNMYKEAIETIADYEVSFGKKFKGDFTLEDIRHEQNEHLTAQKDYQQGGAKIFSRMSIKERGHFSNFFTFFPLKEIQIYNDRLVLKKCSREYSYPWNDINARIVEKTAYKGYGRGSFAKFVQRLLVIKATDKTFKFDVSGQFPDFKHNDILLDELKKHLDLKKGQEKKKGARLFFLG